MANLADKPQEDFSAGLWDAMKGSVAGVSDHFAPGFGSKELTPAEELSIWNERQLSLEQEWELWRAGFTPQEIGLKVFGNRQRLAKSGGRVEPADEIAYANRLALRAEAAKTQKPADHVEPTQPLSPLPNPAGPAEQPVPTDQIATP